MEIRSIGIDLGKTVFHLVGVNARGEVVVRKKCLTGATAPVLSTWLASLIPRKRKQAVPRRLRQQVAPMAWAVLLKGEAYLPPLVPNAA